MKAVRRIYQEFPTQELIGMRRRIADDFICEKIGWEAKELLTGWYLMTEELLLRGVLKRDGRFYARCVRALHAARQLYLMSPGRTIPTEGVINGKDKKSQ